MADKITRNIKIIKHVEIDRNQIEELEEKIFVRKDYLRKLTAKFHRLREYTTENIIEMKSRYEASLERNNLLQRKSKQIFQGMDDDLKHMVSVASDSKREIDKQARMCRNILTIFNVCRKSMSLRERLHCEANVSDTYTPVNDVTELDSFWREVGIIGNSILMLEREFSTLQTENSNLQSKIRRFMSEYKILKFNFASKK